jgi:hypothetical protein
VREMLFLKRAGMIIYILALIAFGTYLLLRPGKFRDFALKNANSTRGLAPVLRRWTQIAFMQSDAYLWYVRFAAIFFYLMAAGMIYALYDSAQRGPTHP